MILDILERKGGENSSRAKFDEALSLLLCEVMYAAGYRGGDLNGVIEAKSTLLDRMFGELPK